MLLFVCVKESDRTTTGGIFTGKHHRCGDFLHGKIPYITYSKTKHALVHVLTFKIKKKNIV